MKDARLFLLASVSLCLIGCASNPRVTVLGPVGPAPVGRAGTTPEGCLQVYAARQKAHVDMNEAEFLQNNDFGKNDFRYRPAHSDYTIYTENGKFVEHIRNARDRNDSVPTLVTLPAGTYRIAAKAEINGSRMDVMLPVRIAPGQCTQVHLQGNWKPHRQFDNRDVVRLPDGQIAGWRATGNAPEQARHSS
jgi:hypothetical protein